MVMSEYLQIHKTSQYQQTPERPAQDDPGDSGGFRFFPAIDHITGIDDLRWTTRPLVEDRPS
jgi:hypothetical protein